MANRIELGGYYASKGEQSLGEVRARFWVEYSNALSQKINEIFANNPDQYDSPRDVLADIVAGELEDEMMEDNEINPDDFDRDEWVESLEEDDSDAE